MKLTFVSCTMVLIKGEIREMNYHNITKDDMLNGDGLRVVLWVSGCTHHCHNCQNPITWDIAGGLPFDEAAEKELFDALAKPHCSGITFSGGDPLHPFNREEVFRLMKKIRKSLCCSADFYKIYLAISHLYPASMTAMRRSRLVTVSP